MDWYSVAVPLTMKCSLSPKSPSLQISSSGEYSEILTDWQSSSKAILGMLEQSCFSPGVSSRKARTFSRSSYKGRKRERERKAIKRKMNLCSFSILATKGRGEGEPIGYLTSLLLCESFSSTLVGPTVATRSEFLRKVELLRLPPN